MKKIAMIAVLAVLAACGSTGDFADGGGIPSGVVPDDSTDPYGTGSQESRYPDKMGVEGYIAQSDFVGMVRVTGQATPSTRPHPGDERLENPPPAITFPVEVKELFYVSPRFDGVGVGSTLEWLVRAYSAAGEPDFNIVVGAEYLVFFRRSYMNAPGIAHAHDGAYGRINEAYPSNSSHVLFGDKPFAEIVALVKATVGATARLGNAVEMKIVDGDLPSDVWGKCFAKGQATSAEIDALIPVGGGACGYPRPSYGMSGHYVFVQLLKVNATVFFDVDLNSGADEPEGKSELFVITPMPEADKYQTLLSIR